ncbi:hypothetical protein, partial [Psychrobacter sp. FME61]|uniref:hypothetical protein n=1 Tax=Psychrobacter sp. FME61 TaxID=2742611 RepID=UPI001866C866
ALLPDSSKSLSDIVGAVQSRSIGVQVLYLLYCGTLTIYNYQSWLEQHYPHAHLKDAYLPQSLLEAVANYKSAEDPTTR